MTTRSRFFASSSGSAVNAVEIGHLDVEHDDVGIGALELLDRLAAGAQRGDDLEVRLPRRSSARQAAHDDGVVDHHDADRVLRARRRGRRKRLDGEHSVHVTRRLLYV